MKTRDSGHIEPADFVWSNLRDDLKARISSEEIDREMVRHLMKTSFPYTTQAHAENAEIPYAGHAEFVPMYIPLKEIITNAGLTRQALIRANGGGRSWGRAVED